MMQGRNFVKRGGVVNLWYEKERGDGSSMVRCEAEGVLHPTYTSYDGILANINHTCL